MKITLRQLQDSNACQSGINEFQSKHGEVWEFDCSLDWQIEFIKSPSRKWFGWLVESGLVPMWSMNGANLRGADLWGANLSDATHSEQPEILKLLKG